MNKLNKTFEQGQVLTHTELNSITGKVDEIVELLSSLGNNDDQNGQGTGTSGMTPLQIQDKIDQAKKALQDTLDKQLKSLWDAIGQIDKLPDGIKKIENDFDWAVFVKNTQEGIAYLSEFKQAYNDITLGTYAKKLEEIDKWYTAIGSQIKLTPSDISMILGAFDEDGNVKVNAASIYMAITENGDGHTLSSELHMNADQVIIGGDVTLTGGLTVGEQLNAINGYIDTLKASSIDTETLTASLQGDINTLKSKMVIVDGQLEAIQATVNDLNVDNTATIKQAIIDDLTTGDLTITGTLHYNKIVGGVKRITSFSQTQLEDGDYFVINEWGSTSSPSSYPTIILPMNPTAGQTLFIQCGSGCIKVKANKQIRYAFAMPIVASGVTGGVTGYSVNWGTCSANDSIDVFDAKWQGVVQFIYDGSSWQQLIHNIRTTA